MSYITGNTIRTLQEKQNITQKQLAECIMKYRNLGNTGLKVSEISMGCEGFAEDACRNTKKLMDMAEKHGINYFDLYASNPEVRVSVGEALKGRRDKLSYSRISALSGKMDSIVRVSELLSLDVSSVNLDAEIPYLRIYGKGDIYSYKRPER